MLESTPQQISPALSGEPVNSELSLLKLSRANFKYEPYPIGIIQNILEPSFYERLVNTFPSVEYFRFMQYHGDKWSLSELNNPKLYHKFLRSNPDWNRLYKEVKSKEFINQIFDALAESKIDLGLTSPVGNGLMRRLRNKLLGRKSSGSFRARFEFSMMRAEGGHILPHTDSPQKLITLVLSIDRKSVV